MPTVELISITPNYMELLKTACSQPYGKDVAEKSIEKIIEKLEEDEDVQNVFHNMKEDDSEEE